MFAKGYSTIRSLGKFFRSLDSFDQDKRLDKEEFMIGLREIGVPLTRGEAEDLLASMDKNRDGFIDFEEFLVAVRVFPILIKGEPSDSRKEKISQVFSHFDAYNIGYISVEDLCGYYNSRQHPKVLKGEYTTSQAFQEFLVNFKDYASDGKITRDVLFI